MKLNITIEIDDAEIARLLGRDVPEPDAEPTKLRLEVGGKYLSRDGKIVTIDLYDTKDDTFKSAIPDSCWYTADGRCLGFTEDTRVTLIARVY